jgi:hypothetical protein
MHIKACESLHQESPLDALADEDLMRSIEKGKFGIHLR